MASRNERKRAKAAQMIADGESVAATSRALHVDASTIFRWMRQEPERFRPREPEPEDEHRALLQKIMRDPASSAEACMKASKELRALDAHNERVRAGSVTIWVAEGEDEPEVWRCAECGSSNLERVDQEDNKP